MKTMYIWRVRAITWEDRHARVREFDMVAPDIQTVLDHMDRMAPEFRDARVESIKMKKEYMGGLK